MAIRIYVSGISGNKEVKKRQQRVLMILDSRNIKYEVVDITEPDKEEEKEFMQEHSKTRDSKNPLPPQIFNDKSYCGDYEDFDMANELDELEKFLNSNTNGVDDTDKPEHAVQIANGNNFNEKESPEEKDKIEENYSESKEPGLPAINAETHEDVLDITNQIDEPSRLFSDPTSYVKREGVEEQEGEGEEDNNEI